MEKTTSKKTTKNEMSKEVLKHVTFPHLTDLTQTSHRGFFIRGYLPPEDISPLFEAYRSWAYILHDKDDKSNHYHYTVYDPKHQTSLLSVAKTLVKLGGDQNWYVAPLGKVEEAHRYFLHIDTASRMKHKHIYSVEEIQTNDAEWAKLSKLAKEAGEATEEKKPDFVEEVIKNELSHVEMARLFGRSYMFHLKQVNDFREAIQVQENELDKAHRLAAHLPIRTIQMSNRIADAVVDNLLPSMQYLKFDIKRLAEAIIADALQEYTSYSIDSPLEEATPEDIEKYLQERQ